MQEEGHTEAPGVKVAQEQEETTGGCRLGVKLPSPVLVETPLQPGTGPLVNTLLVLLLSLLWGIRK